MLQAPNRHVGIDANSCTCRKQRAPQVEVSSDDDGQGDIFGSKKWARSVLPEMAEVSDYIRTELKRERKLFGTVSSQAAAERLGETGNVIKAGENAGVAERANQGIELYDKLSKGGGPFQTLLNRAAQAVADGENANEVKQRTYRAIWTQLKANLDKFTGVPGERSQ